jgi:FkbM family methyltransferase
MNRTVKQFVKTLFPRLPVWRWRATKALATARRRSAVLGWWHSTQIALKEELNVRTRKRIARLHLPGYRDPIFMRAGSSDAYVIEQIFLDRQYSCVDNEPDVNTIIDCGANIGLATFYLLHRYRHARAIVVEPDAGNMALCRLNLEPFKDRVTFLQAGLWDTAQPMIVERGAYRDGEEWSFQVRPAKTNEIADFESVTLPELVRLAGGAVDIVKIDIEGAEYHVFNAADTSWLSAVKTIVMEIHDWNCQSAVAKAMQSFDFSMSKHEELTIYRSSVFSGDAAPTVRIPVAVHLDEHAT